MLSVFLNFRFRAEKTLVYHIEFNEAWLNVILLLSIMRRLCFLTYEFLIYRNKCIDRILIGGNTITYNKVYHVYYR